MVATGGAEVEPNYDKAKVPHIFIQPPENLIVSGCSTMHAN